MKILFQTEQQNAVSTELNAPNFARLAELDGVDIDFFNRRYEDYDVILFMGYDPDVEGVREVNPSAKIGVIDPRPGSWELTRGADFVVVNGLEMQCWCARLFSNQFLYPIYPSLPVREPAHQDRETFVAAYHGNRVHACTLFPEVIPALEALSEWRPVELRLVYNVDQLGALPLALPDPRKVRVRCIQWTPEAYEEHLADADVGLVPNLIPIRDEAQAKDQIARGPACFQEHESDYLTRFKISSNAGRLFVFAQLGVPVVSDFCPSCLQVIRDGVNGFICHGAPSWYRALRRLGESPKLREELAREMQNAFIQDYTIEILNGRFIEFVRGLGPNALLPSSLEDAPRFPPEKNDEKPESHGVLKKILKFLPGSSWWRKCVSGTTGASE